MESQQTIPRVEDRRVFLGVLYSIVIVRAYFKNAIVLEPSHGEEEIVDVVMEQDADNV